MNMNRRSAILGSTAAILGAFVPKGVMSALTPEPAQIGPSRTFYKLYEGLPVVKEGLTVRRLAKLEKVEFECMEVGCRYRRIDVDEKGDIEYCEDFDVTVAPHCTGNPADDKDWRVGVKKDTRDVLWNRK